MGALLQLKEWIRNKAHSKDGELWLAVLSFTESSVFILLPELLLIPMVSLAPIRLWRLVAVTVIASLLGALFGYVIGAGLYESIGKPVVAFYGLEDTLFSIETGLNEALIPTVFIAAFTPIPYKIVTIGAGIFEVPIIPFLVVSLIGRGLRYAVVGWIFARFGETLGGIIFRHFTRLLWALAVLVLVYVIYTLMY